ncbi:MAG: hypothetical protein ACPGU1_04255 [Myxococcota bacterium]
MSDDSISRRRLIGAGLAIAAGGAGAWRLWGGEGSSLTASEAQSHPEVQAPGRTFSEDYEAVRKIIVAGFPFLILPRETVDDFLEALSAAKKRPRKSDDVKQLFLLSTDFFAYGADEARPLRYATLYDPYRNPCYNPMEPA